VADLGKPCGPIVVGLTTIISYNEFDNNIGVAVPNAKHLKEGEDFQRVTNELTKQLTNLLLHSLCMGCSGKPLRGQNHKNFEAP